jgi:PAS domain S-box-containing protein
VIPIGVNSERGLVAAASDRPDFPNQIDHQLLSVAANNAATAFQNAFLIRELRSAQEALRAHEQELRKARDELEIKVEERTAELRRSERELREVIDSIPALIHTARPDGYVDYFNQRWLQYVGLPLEDLLGWKWTAAIHPEDVEAIVEKMRSSMASGEPFLHESRVRRADGEYRWILHRKVAVRDERGQIVKWYGSSFDIEDRKRADEARRRNEFYLSEGQRLAHMGSWGFNPSGFYDYWSEELFRIYGLDPDEGPPTLEQYLACIHPEERAFMAETCGKW